jgi:hypothetical protein
MPLLVINHLRMDECLFLHTNFSAIFSANLFEEIAAETNRYVSEKINGAVPLKEHFIWVQWEDVTTEESMAFHGVILNVAGYEIFRQGLLLLAVAGFFTVLQGYIFKEEIFTVILGSSCLSPS